jgi:DNA polymerase-3 subunit epsilon
VGGINLLQISTKFDIDSRFCKYGGMADGVLTQENIISLPDVDLHNDQIKLLLILFE